MEAWAGKFWGCYPSEGFPSDCAALFALQHEAVTWAALREECAYTVLPTSVKAEFDNGNESCNPLPPKEWTDVDSRPSKSDS